MSALQGMLHQAICSMQLAMIIIKNSTKTASAKVWRQIVSQKSIGSHSVYKKISAYCKVQVSERFPFNNLKLRVTTIRSTVAIYKYIQSNHVSCQVMSDFTACSMCLDRKQYHADRNIGEHPVNV